MFQGAQDFIVDAALVAQLERGFPLRPQQVERDQQSPAVLAGDGIVVVRLWSFHPHQRVLVMQPKVIVDTGEFRTVFRLILL